MSNHPENYDELAHIETMSAEELRQELRDAIAFHQQCLISNRHETKQIKAINREMEVALQNGIKTLTAATEKTKQFSLLLDRAAHDLMMWRRSCYALALLVIVLACWATKQGGVL